MTKEKLQRANYLENEIFNLEHFSRTCISCWNDLTIERIGEKFKLITCYGALRDEIEVDNDLSKKILKVIMQDIADKKKELEEL